MMEIKYQIFVPDGLLIQKYNGLFCLEEFLRYNAFISKKLSSSSIKKVLLDFRDLIFSENNDEMPNDFRENLDKIIENRKINPSHQRTIKQAMELNLNFFPPIMVNSRTNNIIDGQHRSAAFIELVSENKLPSDSTLDVKFLDMSKTTEIDLIIDTNVNSRKWNLDDYVSSLSKKNVHYATLTNWCTNHSLCNHKGRLKYRYAAAMLTGKTGCSRLKNGSFIVTEANLRMAENVHAEIIEILDILNKKKKSSFLEALTISWMEVRHLHSFTSWKREIKKKKNMLIKKPDSCKSEWDNIFNQVLRGIQLKKK